MSDKLELELIGAWDGMTAALDGDAMQRRLERALVTAHKRIGRKFAVTARRKIRGNRYAPNSAMTIAIKGSAKPLVASGALFQSITFEQVGPYELRLGLIRARSGAEVINIGAILHEGATIDMRKHPKVRAAVWAKARQGVGKAGLAGLSNNYARRTVISAAIKLGLRSRRRKKQRMTERQRRAFFARRRKESGSGGASSTAKAIWRIPARPFIAEPLSDPAFVAFVRDTWAEAVQRALFPPSQRPGRGNA